MAHQGKNQNGRRRSWPLDVMGGKYLAVRREDLRPLESPLNPGAAWKIMERAVKHSQNVPQLAELGNAVRQGGIRSMGTIRLEGLHQAFMKGELVLLLRADRSTGVETQAASATSVAEELKVAKELKTWVEIEVVDPDGNPVSGRKFVCVLPDGKTHDGVLDKSGRVRFDNIDPGTCSFSLVDVDRETWERVA